jgi:hypothetical protein
VEGSPANWTDWQEVAKVSDYSEEGKRLGVPLNYDDAGQMQTTETVRAMQGDDTDMPGPGLDIGAKIHLQLCAISEKQDRDFKTTCAKEQARLAAMPIRTSFSATTTAGANTWALATFQAGGPKMGRQWHIRGAVVANMAHQITHALLCVGPPAAAAGTNLNGPTPGDLSFVKQSLLGSDPNFASGSWAPGAVTVHAGDVPYILLETGSSVDITAVTISIEDEPWAALTEITGVE